MKREGEEGWWREEHSCTTLINHSDFFIFPFSLYVIISQLIAIVAGTIEILSKANTLVCRLHYLPAVFSISRCFPRILPFNCSCYFPLNCSSALLLSLSDFSLCAFLITNNAHATLNFACDAFGTENCCILLGSAICQNKRPTNRGKRKNRKRKTSMKRKENKTRNQNSKR